LQNIRLKSESFAKILHITLGVSQKSLLSTIKFADANYITIFDKDTVNIYDANNTIITATKGAILQGWQDKNSNLWHIPLVHMVRNHNTDTVLLNRPPCKFLLNQPDPVQAVHCVNKLKTQLELVWYLHLSAGFSTKPTWLKAIKNKQFSSWPGLTTDAVRRHFPDSDKTHKGHGQRTPSRLWSTKQTQAAVQPEEQDNNKNIIATK
jgi:hypothetical protein